MRAEVMGGEATACRCNAEAEDVFGGGRRTSFVAGAEVGRVVGAEDPFVAACISPAAEEILLVKEDIAQPAHPLPSLGCGVLMRGVVVVTSVVC